MKLPKEFPSISRIITEKTLKKFYAISSVILSLFAVILLGIFIVLMSVNFLQNFANFQKIYAQRQEISGSINFWNSIADKYSGYPDAYFNIAILYYKLGNFENARKYLLQTLVLNPDYKNANHLEALLKNRGY